MPTTTSFNLKNLSFAEEIQQGVLSLDEAQRLILQDEGLSFIDCMSNSLLLGQTSTKSAKIKVCTNIGISNADGIETELKKIESLNKLQFKPHIIFDHTRKLEMDKPFWKHMVEHFDGVIATAPVLICFDESKGLDKSELLERIAEMAENGVRLMLFHPTATGELYRIAEQIRIRATTSWNGGLLKRDIILNNRTDSLITEIFDEILKILHKYNVTCDIGTVFRPSRISEALDEVHRGELTLQEKFIKQAKAAGVFAIREGVGHISLDKIQEFCSLLDKSTPIMPLPVSTDAAIGFDHVACAVAVTLIGYYTNLGIINPVTRVEHTGGIPTLTDIIEALQTAKTVAHSLDLRNIPSEIFLDNLISDARQTKRSCRVSGGLFDNNAQTPDVSVGCSRCDIAIPLDIHYKI
jgi:phosphomethylpyrimidine synthase